MAGKRVAALAIALALAAGAGASVLHAFDGRVAEDPVLGYPSLEEVTDFDLLERSYACRLAAGSNPALVFGSSELNPGAESPAHPTNLLAGGRYGMDLMVVGRAFCEDLWQAVEVGAFAGELDSPRIVLIPSMQWFMCYRNPRRDFQAAFSEGAYDAFMANRSISEELKGRVTERMARYGVDRRARPGSLAEIPRALDQWASGLAADLRLATSWTGGALDEPLVAPGPRGREDAGAPPAGAPSPDWDAVFAAADASARSQATENDLGIADAWYGSKCDEWLEGASRWRVEDGEYFSHEELEDFEMLLEVCREAGLEPLVLLQPVKGALYDRTAYTRDVRQGYYEMMRAACADAGVACADFSDHEYDAYFLREYSHPSDLGGAYYSKAIFRWIMDGVVDVAPAGGVAVGGAEGDR